MSKSKIIKIVYPANNGTLRLFKKARWDVITKDTTYYVYDYATIRAIVILEELYNGKVDTRNMNDNKK